MVRGRDGAGTQVALQASPGTDRLVPLVAVAAFSQYRTDHLIVDALTTVFPFGSEPFIRLREQFWVQVFADAARVDRSLTFTFTPESTVQAGFSDGVRATVEAHGGSVAFVRLVVDPDEQERRIGADDRRAFHKLTDVAVLRRLRNNENGVEQPPVDLEVDTGASSAAQSAHLIAEHFGLRP